MPLSPCTSIASPAISICCQSNPQMAVGSPHNSSACIPNVGQLQDIWSAQLQQMQYFQQMQAAIIQRMASDSLASPTNPANNSSANNLGNQIIFPNIPNLPSDFKTSSTNMSSGDGFSQSQLAMLAMKGMDPSGTLNVNILNELQAQAQAAGIDPAFIQMASLNLMANGPRPGFQGPFPSNVLDLNNAG